MATLTKTDIAKKLHDKIGISKAEADEIVESFFDEIRHTLESGKNLDLSGFGNFQLNDKKQRPGRNPKTGAEVMISARRVVTFKPSTTLKLAMKKLSNDVLSGRK